MKKRCGDPTKSPSADTAARRGKTTARAAEPDRSATRPRKPRGWNGAEFLHMQMHAGSMLPFASEPLSAEDTIESWRAMIGECEQFYPAHLELGTHLVKIGKEAEGREHLDRGIVHFVRFSEHPEEEVGALVTNLERGWRFDLLRALLERIVERWPNVGWFHDDLAHAAARTGDFATARSAGAQALELEPESAGFRSNLALYALLEGRLDEAAAHVDRALKLDRKL